MKCPNCAYESLDINKYCPSCGGKMPKKSFGGVVSALLKIVVCIIIMILCSSGVMTAYMGSEMAKDKSFAVNIQAVYTKYSGKYSESGLSEEDELAMSEEIEEVYNAAYEKITTKASGRMTAITLIGNMLTVLVIFLGMRLRHREPMKFLRFRAVNPTRLVTFLLFGAALNIVITCVIEQIPFPKKIVEEYAELFSDIYNGNDTLLVQIIGTVIITPIVEEIIFRAFALTHLRPVMNEKLAVVVSAVFFAAVHYGSTPSSFIAVGYAFFMGLLFGWAFLKYDSIVPSLLFHIGFNGITFVKFGENYAQIVIPLAVIVAVYLGYRIFIRFPTYSDFVFDTECAPPVNDEEKRIISRIREIKSGEEEPDREELEALSKAWHDNRAALTGKVKIKTDERPADDTDGADNKTGDRL